METLYYGKAKENYMYVYEQQSNLHNKITKPKFHFILQIQVSLKSPSRTFKKYTKSSPK